MITWIGLLFGVSPFPHLFHTRLIEFNQTFNKKVVFCFYYVDPFITKSVLFVARLFYCLASAVVRIWVEGTLIKHRWIATCAYRFNFSIRGALVNVFLLSKVSKRNFHLFVIWKKYLLKFNSLLKSFFSFWLSLFIGVSSEMD